MKHLYVIVIKMDEDSIYFTEMTEAQMKKMVRVLDKSRYNFDIQKIKAADGFNSYSSLIKDFKDLAN